MGRFGDLHRMRKMRTGVSNGRTQRKGKERGRDVETKTVPAVPDIDERRPAMNRVRVATVWLDGCSGCHMSFLDIDERLIELAGKIDLVYSPLVDAKEFPAGVDVALVEGAISTESDLHKIREIRENTRVLVSLGDCAVTGNVPSMRDVYPVSEVLSCVYDDIEHPESKIPDQIVPRLLKKVR